MKKIIIATAFLVITGVVATFNQTSTVKTIKVDNTAVAFAGSTILATAD